MIVWLNGGFGAGKTALAAELHRRLPDAVVYDPEDVGLLLWKWLPPNEDFQDLPSWRELVVAAALSLRRHHAPTLIVPMSLLRGAYREEIIGGLADAGERILHVFLDAAPEVLADRLRQRTPADARQAGSSLEWALSRLDAGAAARQPAGTLVAVPLRSAGHRLLEEPEDLPQVAADRLGAGWRHLDEPGPLVVRVGDAAHQAASFQLVHLPGDVRADDLHPVRDLPHPQRRTGGVQGGEHRRDEVRAAPRRSPSPSQRERQSLPLPPARGDRSSRRPGERGGHAPDVRRSRVRRCRGMEEPPEPEHDDRASARSVARRRGTTSGTRAAPPS